MGSEDGDKMKVSARYVHASQDVTLTSQLMFA